MRFYTRKTHRSLRRAVRTAVKQSPALRREAKRAQRGNPSTSGNRAASALTILIALGFLASLTVRASADDSCVGLLAPTLISVGWLLLHVDGLVLTGGSGWTHASVLYGLPVDDAEIVRHAWQRNARRSGWMLLFFATFYAAWAVTLAVRDGSRTPPWPWIAGAAATAAVAQYLIVRVLTVALAVYRPSWARAGYATFIIITLALLVAFYDVIRDALRAPAAQALLVLPFAWPAAVFRWGMTSGNLLPLLLLAPMLAAALLLRRLQRMWLARTVLTEERFLPAPSQGEEIIERLVDAQVALASEHSQELVDNPELKPQVREQVRQAIHEWVAACIRANRFLELPQWERLPPLERIAVACLTPREKHLAEYLMVLTRWSRRWLIMAGGLTAIGLLLVLLRVTEGWGRFDLGWPMLGAIVALIATVLATPMAGGQWLVNSLAWSAGHYLPACALLPVGYWEASRLMLKVNHVRWLAWAPFPVAFGALTGWLVDGAPVFGLLIALKLILAMVALQPVWVLGNFYSGTSEYNALRLRTLGLAFVPLIGYIAAAVALFTLPGALWFLVSAVALFACPWGLWAVYGLIYTRGRVNTVRLP